MDKSVCTVQRRGKTTVVRVTRSKLYLDVVKPFQDTMVSLLESGEKRIVIDLSDVDVMDSSGLGVLILTWDRLRKEDGRFVVVGLRPIMEKLFQRMRFDLLFTIVESEAEALKLMRGDKKIPAT